MNDRKYPISTLARLHDLLKLTGDSKVHWCPDRHPDASTLKVNSPDLWKALKHHCVFNSRRGGHGCAVAVDREAFCISIADHTASAISRRLKHIYAGRSVFHVWRDEPKAYGEAVPIPGVFEDACNTPDLEVLFGRKMYQNEFARRPETMNRADGSSFTSLLTHAELTAVWAEFFMGNADYYGIPEGPANIWEMKRGIDKSSVVLLRCKIRTHGRLARLRDLQMVKEVAEKRAELAGALGGALLYELPDEFVVAVTPDVESEARGLLEKHLTTSHFVELNPVKTVLKHSRKGKGFLHNFGELFAGYPRVAYPDLPPVIEPDHRNEASSRAILCDLCQLAPATVVYPREVHPDSEQDPISEYLCRDCTELRKRSETKAKRLANWEESLDANGADAEDDTPSDTERPRVCLVKVSLDMGELVDALIQLFKATFDKAKDRGLEDEDIGFSILREFLLDYKRFVEAFEKRVLEIKNGRYSGENHDKIMDGFLALRIKKDNEAADIVREYVKLYDEYFPKLKGEIAPIKLSVSCSHIKHPFLEHWDVIDKPSAPIEVNSVRRARLSVDFRQLEALEDINAERNGRVSSFLHNLTEIEARTQSTKLVRFALLEKNREAEIVVQPFMDDVVQIRDILSYYKLFVQGREK